MITRTKNQQFNPNLFSIHGKVIWGDRLQVSRKMDEFHNFVKSSTSGGTSSLIKICFTMFNHGHKLFDLIWPWLPWYTVVIMPYAVETAVFRVGGQGHVLRSFPGHSWNSNVGITGMHVLYGNTCLHLVIYSQSNFT